MTSRPSPSPPAGARHDGLSRLLADPSPFYAPRIAAACVDDPDAFARLPLSRREELLDDQLAHLPLGTRRARDAGTPVRTGIAGTGDRLLVLAWSAAELARERAAGTRLLRALGLDAGMRIANALPGALVTPGSLLLGDVVEELGALDVPLGVVDSPAAAAQAWELLERVRPDVIVCDDGSAALFDGAPEPAPSWWHGLVRLRRGDVATPGPLPGFRGWQRTWLAVPEATSFVAGSCDRDRLHVDEQVVAEVVDGELVLTPLGLETRLFRYATGIRVRGLADACPCGRPGPVLEVA